MSATTTKAARILGCGREPRTTEYAPPPPGAFFPRIDWAGCVIVTIGLPDSDQLLPILIYVCRMCPGPRLKRTFALLKATLTRVQALLSIRGTRGIAAFSTRTRFWRDTPSHWTAVALFVAALRSKVHNPRCDESLFDFTPLLPWCSALAIFPQGPLVPCCHALQRRGRRRQKIRQM